MEAEERLRRGKDLAIRKAEGDRDKIREQLNSTVSNEWKEE